MGQYLSQVPACHEEYHLLVSNTSLFSLLSHRGHILRTDSNRTWNWNPCSKKGFPPRNSTGWQQDKTELPALQLPVHSLPPLRQLLQQLVLEAQETLLLQQLAITATGGRGTPSTPRWSS